MSSLPGPSQETIRAWPYYQHADTIQHSRHNFFMVAQAMLFAAFASLFAGNNCKASFALLVTLSLLGGVFSLAWYFQAQRLSNGMTALSSAHLESRGDSNGDPVYKIYLDGLAFGSRTPTGREILNVLLPGACGLAWVSFFAVVLCKGC